MKNHRSNRLTWLIVPLTLGVGAVSTGLNADSRTQAARRYAIPAESLNEALTDFADQADVKLVYNAELVRGLTSPALTGPLSVSQGFNALLKGTGLGYRMAGNNTVVIEHKPSPKPIQPVADRHEPQSNSTEGQVMPKVTVEADAEYDAEYYADPYNKDYVIPNATAGTKTDTPIMETPLNVQVISKQVLKERQAFTLADALKNVSGVQTISNGVFLNNAQSIFLRGFDSQTFFRDGFRLTQGSASREFANVESVEVLKGSVAILYGLVEPGGMINVITKKPLATPYYGFTQQAGSFDTYRSTLDATGPIAGDKDLLYRVNMSYENSGSFRDFVGKEDVFFAPKLTWNISPKTQANFELEYNHAHLGIDYPIIPLINGKPLTIPRSRSYGEYSPATEETVFGSFNWSHQFNDDWSLKHRFSANHYSFNTDSLTYINATGPFDGFGLPGYGVPNGLTGRYKTKTGRPAENNTYATNLDVIGHFDTWDFKHTLLMGGDYYRLTNTTDSRYDSYSSKLSFIDTLNPIHPGTSFGFPVYNYTLDGITSGPAFLSLGTPSKSVVTTDQFGLYIQDQIKLLYDLHVTGGIRWQYIHNRTDATNFNKDLSFASASTEGSAQDAVTPRVGILWNPEKWISLYANYTESFGANTGKIFVKPRIGKIIDPTSATQYEGGLKLEFFSGKLRGTFAYYDLTKTNIAATDPKKDHDCGTGPGSCFVPIGEARSRGPEIDIQGEILPGWNVIANWTNLDILITKASPIDPNLGQQGNDFVAGKVGDRPTNQPRNTGTIWSTYEIQSGDFQGFQFGGGLNFTSRTYTGDKNFPNPGFITMDLMAGYSRKIDDATISAQLNVTNLLDKYYTTLYGGDCGGNFICPSFGTPRTFMGQVSIQY